MLSRVADSLYWMSRYMERAEHTARLIAVKLESMIEQSREDADCLLGARGRALSAEESRQAPHDAFAITRSAGLRPRQSVFAAHVAAHRARQCPPGARAAVDRGLGESQPALSAAASR